jgi:hypothetical protein
MGPNDPRFRWVGSADPADSERPDSEWLVIPNRFSGEEAAFCGLNFLCVPLCRELNFLGFSVPFSEMNIYAVAPSLSRSLRQDG